MGIPAYFSFIVSNHSNILKKFDNKLFNINNLFIDANSIIYDSVHNLNKNKETSNLDNDKYEKLLIKKVIEKIKEYIDIIKPDNEVFIAFDGVAPVAKLEQQRNRRFKNSFIKNLKMRYLKDFKETWDTTKITPGTKFMDKLDKQINKFKKYKNVKTITISSSKFVGEGEHKIYEKLRTNNFKQDNTVIYGLDADLIMLTLNHLKYSKNIYLFRETPHFIKQIASDIDPDKLYILDIPRFANILENKLSKNCSDKSLDSKIEFSKIYDYIFLCFLVGNDFIPHIPCINIRNNGINHLLDAYNEVISNNDENLIDNFEINWNQFRKLVLFLKNNEINYYNLEYSSYYKKSKKFKKIIKDEKDFDEKLNFIPKSNRDKEFFIDVGSTNWQYKYYKVLFDIEYDVELIKNICINYLESLEWSFKYYTVGCPDWRWKYKYNYAPLLEDLVKYIPFFKNEFISNNNNKPINENTQLAFVLPRVSLYLLPDNIHNKLIQTFPNYYNNSFKFNWAFCKYFWESHAELPHINLNEIEELCI